MKVFRGFIIHTPGNPFVSSSGLEAYVDGAIVVANGRVVAVGDYAELRTAYPGAESIHCRPGLLLPGLIDTHVHYPQVSVIGAMGMGLLPWLQQVTLPEEARLADGERARQVARLFLNDLIRHGVTTALVFGAHFVTAQEIFFAEAAASGLRITSGLVMSDRQLRPELHQTPDEAYCAGQQLIQRWHGKGRLRYAVTPRFALSTSGPMLEVARALLTETPGVLFQTHLNETTDEIATVLELFPGNSDYLGVYEEYDLLGPRSVFAHNVHPVRSELQRLAAAGAAVAHCPSSNSFLGSGLFPLRAHLQAGIKLGLGSDVGAGTGFGILKEGLMAYQVQRLHSAGYPLGPEHLLYLATRGGAEALAMGDVVGDFSPGKEADFIWIRPPEGSTLAALLAESSSAQAALGAVFTLAGAESIAEVYVSGEPVKGSQRTPD